MTAGMQELVASMLFGAVFGLALAAPPGPMNAVIAEESVLRGWTAGFAAGLGAMTADAMFLGLAWLGAVRVVETVPALRDAMVGVGGLLMFYFALAAVRDADVDWTAAEAPTGRGFLKALALALTNPYQILFWLTVGVGLLRPGTVDVLAHTPYLGSVLADRLVVRTGSPALLIGLFGGIGLWITGFPASLVVAGQRVDRFAPIVAYTSAAVLVLFGTYFLADAAGFAG